MKVAVLVKQVPDTWSDRRIDLVSGRVDRSESEQVIDEIDERALEVALRFKDGDKSTEVVAVGMGPDGAKDALRRSLAIGADAAVHILDEGLVGADAMATGAVLAAALRGGGYDLVLAGNVSTDGRGGVIPGVIAEHLGVPLLSSLDELETDGDKIRGRRTVETGTQRLHATLPVIATITERVPEARFPGFKSVLAAKKKPFSRLGVAELGVAVPAAASVVVDAAKRLPREAGRVVVDDGSAAADLVAYLALQRLI